MILCAAGRLDALFSVAPSLRISSWHGSVAITNGDPPGVHELAKVGLARRRMLDRYYLVFDPEVVQTRVVVERELFEIVAPRYEQLIDVENNRQNLRSLLRLVTCGGGGDELGVIDWQRCVEGHATAVVADIQKSSDCADQSAWVLDYGCGTGLIRTVAHEFTVKVIGCDVNQAMLGHARRRGLAVVTLEELRALPDGYFDAVIAAYLLHLAIPVEELFIVFGRLRVGGHLAANFHKGYGYNELSEALIRFGGFTEEHVTDDDFSQHGRYGLWRRDA